MRKRSRSKKGGKGKKVDVYQMVTDMIVEKLEAGVIPWHKPWKVSGSDFGSFGFMGACPRNLVSNKPYRGVNVIMLGMQGYDSPYWMTFKQANERGGHVKRGEHGSIVVYWKVIEVEDEVDGEKIKKKIPFLRYYKVFNLEQTEDVRVPKGRIKEEPEDGADDEPDEESEAVEFDPIAAAEAIINEMPNAPKISHGGNRAYYRPSADEVRLPEKDQFDSPATYYNTAFHELVHSTGHESRVGRKGVSEPHFFGDHGYSQEELVAEMGAAFLAAEAGIVNETADNSAAYIANWLKSLKNDKKMVVFAAGQAQKAADYIRNRKREYKDDDKKAA